MLYIGVDPGAGGGFAVVDDTGAYAEAVAMPKTERDVLDMLKVLGGPGDARTRRAVLEHVWSIPGQGGAFKFGKSVGHLEMALTAAEIPYDQVLPKRWQQALGIHYKKGDNDVVKKNITKRRAQQLFPSLTITHAIADALLMAEYCRRLHRGSNGKEAEGRGAQGSTKARGSKGKGYRAGEIARLATPPAAGAHPRHAHQAARQSDRRAQRPHGHDRDGVDGGKD
jgi:hypothetical protein